VVTAMLTFITAVAISREVAYLWNNTFAHLAAMVFTVVPAFIIYMNISVSVIQTIFARFYKPAVMPSMNFETGIPESSSVFFVMPVLMKNSARVKEIMSELEIIYLANREKNIYFAVVADAAESDCEKADWDSDVYNTGLKEAERLNKKYAKAGKNKFYFLYRPRVYHECEGKWLGKERKRGALIDFNKLVTGEHNHRLLGMTENVPNTKFIFTVDADTRIPNNAIKKMAAICAHPLNQPIVEYSGGCAFVKRGYGILQPAVMTEPTREGRSPFAETYTGDVGIDAYFARNSDFYFDVCSEGIYTGKGMYDPKVFNEISKDTFRDETVLSHDLLEGSYMRTAFTSNIMIFDGFPGNYVAYIKRQHRWIRGDWQLLPYKKEMFINRLGRKVKNPLNFISLYKMTNNLQRSLGAPCSVLVFIVGMIFVPRIAWLWHLILLGYSYYPCILNPTAKTFKRCSLSLCSLPHEAYMTVDAIVRTLWRINVSHKHLLEWVTAADAEKSAIKTVAGYYRYMWQCIVMGIVTVSPISLLWFAAPLILKKTGENQKSKITQRMLYNDIEVLALTRRMWAFYEDYAPENSFLPPDNVQFKPEIKTAKRTSPTNIGFYILCTAQASHLGFITLGEAFYIIEQTLGTMEKMKKLNGHLLNWYGTKDLEVLNPPFISTVDSGNLAVCMVTAAEILSREKERYENDPCDVIKSRFYALKALAEIIWEDNRNDLDDRLKLPEDFDGTNLDEWGNILNSCIKFCEKNIWDNQIDGYLNKLYSSCRIYADELKKSQKVSAAESATGVIVCNTKAVSDKLNKFAFDMDFSFLFDRKKGCFATGFSVKDNRLSDSHYDIAVSEARLSVYFAIAKGDVSADAFYRPARRFADRGEGILRSWSGTAFEYLLPELFFKSYPKLLWDKTTKLMIEAQRDYGKLKGVPWGISESGYNMRDVNLNYQYKAFGVPILAMSNDCCDRLVIAPYASLMAMEFAPSSVKENMKALKENGAFGKYGFYEAIDFTKDSKGVVESCMAHHIGMAFTGCANYLDRDITGEAFSSVPEFKACELLLAEKCDKDYGDSKVKFDEIISAENLPKKTAEAENDYFIPFVHDGISSLYPAVNHYSGKNVSLFVNELGDNLLSVGDMSITCERGLRFFIRECNSGKVWTATADKGIVSDSDEYRVLFYPERAIFCKNTEGFNSELHLCVSGEESSAVYRLEITNGTAANAVFEISAFTEIAASGKNDFDAHRSYSDINTVTESKTTNDRIILFADKVYNSGMKDDISVFLSIWSDKAFDGAVGFDTETIGITGRGNFAEIPSAVAGRRPLGAKQGAVLTPCFAGRVRIAAVPGETVNIYTALGAAAGFEDAMPAKARTRMIAEKYRDNRAVTRTFDIAYTNAVTEREKFNLSKDLLEDFGTVLKQIYSREKCVQLSLLKGQTIANEIIPCLWKFGISGNNPLIVTRVMHSENSIFTEKIIDLWKLLYSRGVCADLVIIVNETDGYMAPLYSFVEYRASLGMCDARLSGVNLNCGIFAIKESQITDSELNCIYAAASSVLVPKRRNRIGIVSGAEADRKISGYITSCETEKNGNLPDIFRGELCFDNVYGGFSPDGKRYFILNKKNTPAPWINCISSFFGEFGFTVSERGGGFVWYKNSHEYRLTPWCSSPAHDAVGEAIFVRNEINGRTFSLTGFETQEYEGSRCVVTEHGFGYSEFVRTENGLKTTLNVFAHSVLPLKISLVEIENVGANAVDISIAYCVKPVAEEKNITGSFLETYWDDDNNFLACENKKNHEIGEIFAKRLFITSSLVPDSFTCDETEFYGNEFQRRLLKGIPVAMGGKRILLSDKSGFGLNTCMAMKNTVTIKSGSAVSVIYVLGAEPKNDKEVLESALKKLRNPFNAFAELDTVKELWNDFLGKIEVRTPDKAFDFMVNGWLLYQLKSCRIDGRSGFYQSGGAYGFRDQLQDAVALLHSSPETVKKQILLCASRQYEEGDVQHWWHPPENRGVRTNYSDDLLWLPYAVCKYVEFTDDASILYEQVPFLKSEPLKPTEHDRYEKTEITDYTESLFEHLKRATEHAMRFGTHDLPFMGGGDWNDGMNKVGENGGESVWLGWFLCKIFKCMEYLSNRINAGLDYSESLAKLSAAIEENAWENDRYIRAFYGDGTPLGSASCVECEIDSISQSWSVISGAGDKERSLIAINTAYTNLVDKSAKVIRLLSPAFTGLSQKNPGYISDYPAGIRENGAQYTHAAIWLAKAFYESGDASKGYELLSMLNPINHSRTQSEADIYKVEPYVMAADVYYGGINTGRGGWTWYTGSAGWYYRLCIENLIGLKRRSNILYVSPALPPEWRGKATVIYRHNGKNYEIDLSKGSQKIILK